MVAKIKVNKDNEKAVRLIKKQLVKVTIKRIPYNYRSHGGEDQNR